MIRCVCFGILAAFLLAAPPYGAMASGDLPAPSAQESTRPPAIAEAPRDLPDHLEAVCLIEVVDGRPRETVWCRETLAQGRTPATPGHVAGVVVVSRQPGLVASLGDAGAGTQPPASPWKLAAESPPTGSGRRYSVRARVPGDAVSREECFALLIEGADRPFALPIRQSGYQPLLTPDEETAAAPRFSYVGSRRERFRQRRPDLHDRVRAIRSGIAKVEEVLGGGLVQRVNVLDYQGPDNALSVRGHADLWFYAETFWNQDPAELTSMAEHETLHLVVDREGYTGRPAVRELFADLRGFGPLSLERFALVAGGRLPAAAAAAAGTGSLLLPFVDERNFLADRRGGHAGDSLDEFCTSFLHTLLYLDRLEDNLRRPHLRLVDGTTLELTPNHRTDLLRDYRRSLDVLAGTAPAAGPQGPAAEFIRRCAAATARVALLCQVAPIDGAVPARTDAGAAQR
jgi:hypothetical protein